jgi:hypothetical protein
MAAARARCGGRQHHSRGCCVQGYFYYLFGFLFIVAALTVIITIEVSVLCTCAPPALHPERHRTLRLALCR